ncbi:hypothetical protein KP79_PYT00174 [Mizuhopecten yessoensis]|uniref:B box-type domain-containing protein n=1 Tax=Mizuhopecten yessoensis TaxID=6573 RepID=A0A210R4S6_MIZYE|nr:hypothetical protein KP79_PYT00174 [Mizuhopecten yessoensis]
MAERVKYCDVHTADPCSIMCVTCGKMVCFICQHGTHRSHEFSRSKGIGVPGQSASQQWRNDIQDLKEKKWDFEKGIDDLKLDVKSRSTLLTNMIMDLEKETLAQIESFKKENIETCDRAINAIKAACRNSSMIPDQSAEKRERDDMVIKKELAILSLSTTPGFTAEIRSSAEMSEVFGQLTYGTAVVSSKAAQVRISQK